MSDKKKDKDKKKKKQSVLEAEIFRFMEKSLKSAMEVALDDIFKDCFFFFLSLSFFLSLISTSPRW